MFDHEDLLGGLDECPPLGRKLEALARNEERVEKIQERSAARG